MLADAEQRTRLQPARLNERLQCHSHDWVNAHAGRQIALELHHILLALKELLLERKELLAARCKVLQAGRQPLPHLAQLPLHCAALVLLLHHLPVQALRLALRRLPPAVRGECWRGAR